ncbi:carbamoyltransferase C-terminal domain-containing protein [Sorangium sp. So ce1014]|uniref:carbamoyltransferase family protein n=1 Tax=Sorangium sp. So ce1014 TaxID=3133326 RepID=UPI003F5F4E36
MSVIVGISAFYHDAACCLLRDGELVAAAQEERFSRVKYDPAIPVRAFLYCLREAKLDLLDVDAVAYYEDPAARAARQIWSRRAGGARGAAMVAGIDPSEPMARIRDGLGFDGPIHCVEHHRSHAASAFYCSAFDAASVLTVDGVGEWSTTGYWRGEGVGLELLESVDFPDSIGLFYSAITAYLGFGVNSGECKLMGLAPYGRPRFTDLLRGVIRDEPGGRYSLDLRCFDFIAGDRMYTPEFEALLRHPPRRPDDPIEAFHEDLAASAQEVLSELLISKVRYLHGRTGLSALCLAGGVALNCAANGRILREGPFQRVFVQPAAGDAGACIGAAAALHAALEGSAPRIGPLRSVALGPAALSRDCRALADAVCRVAPNAVEDFRGRSVALVDAAATRLARGGVLGWYQDRMEFGPRALGCRSILADPRVSGMRERINTAVKKREAFRPFAPSVLRERAVEHMDLDEDAPFMTITCRVRSPLLLPAITHVDGSARPQTVDNAAPPLFRALLERFFAVTGCPVLLNTSFNLRGMPIVCTPEDALLCFAMSGLDALVLGDFVIERRLLPAAWERFSEERWRQRANRYDALPVYTFF